jgi:hypothetical protein
MERHRIPLALAFVLTVAGAAPLSGQTVRGLLVEQGSGEPVGAAFVALLDASGRQVAGALSDSAGRYVVRAPAPGRYTLRVDRLGLRSTRSEALELAAGEVVSHRLEVPVVAIMFEGIVAESERRCVIRPAEGLATARVWDEARKALAAASWLETQQMARFEAIRYERELDADRLTVLHETAMPVAGYATRPYASVPAETLAAEGFARSMPDGSITFYAPDADVLLSDAFLDTHCMRLVDGKGETAGLIGVAFEPVRGRRVPEIAGTFWLDRRTAELRYLEFRYVQLQLNVPTDRVGGRVEFERLPTGAWIVRRWWIRMPSAVEDHAGAWNDHSIRERRVTRIREEGGEVVGISTVGGRPSGRVTRAALAGTVFDSTRTSPLAGARVYLSGTSYAAETDAEGRYRIDDLPEGVYTIAFSHPRLDSLPALPVPPKEIELRRGETIAADLAVPPIERIADLACPMIEGDRSPPGIDEDMAWGVVAGVVRDVATGQPLAGARVTLAWSEWGLRLGTPGGPGPRRAPTAGERTYVRERAWTAETTTDFAGRYAVCRLPVGVTIRASAAEGRRTGEAVSFEIPADGAARVDLDVGRRR